MSDEMYTSFVENQKEGLQLLEKVMKVTEPGIVFSEPIVSGDRSVLTASEVVVGVGFGYGQGRSQPEALLGPDEESEFGQGGGGGGGSLGRPVATITVSPDGVEVTPILDLTKVWIAVLTTLGSMFFMLARMRRGLRR